MKIIKRLLCVALLLTLSLTLSGCGGVSDTIIQYAANAYQEVLKLGYHTKTDTITDVCYRKYDSLDEIDVPPYPYRALISGQGYIFYFCGSPNMDYDSAIAFVDLNGKVTVAYDDRAFWGAYSNLLSKVVGRATDEQVKQASNMANSANPLHNYLWPKLSTVFKTFRNDKKATGITAYFSQDEITRMKEKLQ